jgi:hypothetical protein
MQHVALLVTIWRGPREGRNQIPISARRSTRLGIDTSPHVAARRAFSLTLPSLSVMLSVVHAACLAIGVQVV